MIPMRAAMRSALAHAVAAGERWRSGVAYNPLSDRMAQDPYPVYAAMHRRSPVHRSRLLNAWLFARHADGDAILRDHRNFGNDPRKGSLTPRQRGMLPPPEEFTLLFLDPPDHGRLRALVSKAFTSHAVNAIETRIRAIVASLPGAANRDPEAFDAPDRLDVGRAVCPHLSLGRGIHHCMGGPLARLEARIAIEMLLERFAEIALADERPRFRHGVVLHGLRSLHRRLKPCRVRTCAEGGRPDVHRPRPVRPVLPAHAGVRGPGRGRADREATGGGSGAGGFQQAGAAAAPGPGAPLRRLGCARSRASPGALQSVPGGAAFERGNQAAAAACERTRGPAGNP